MKLSALTIILIGVSIAIITLSYAAFHHVMPNLKAREYQRTYLEQLKAEAAKQERANQKVQTAIKMVEEKAAEWRAIVAVKTPLPDVSRGGINIAVNPWQLTVDSRKFRNNMQRALNAQLKKGGVTVVSAPQIPEPTTEAPAILQSYYNYPQIAFPVVFFDLGTVTVRGTYSQIMAHVRSFKNMPRYLAVASNLQLTGTSPVLTGTYNLSLVGYIRGTQVFPPVPQMAAGGGGNTGGGPGGGGPGVPSGRGGGPGIPGRGGAPGGGAPGEIGATPGQVGG